MSIKALGALQLPSQKEWAAGLGGLVAFGIIAVCNYLGHPLGDETDSLLVVVLPPLISKLVPPSATDVLTHVNDAIVEAGVIAGKLTPPAQIVANDPNNTLVLQPAQLVSTMSPLPAPPQPAPAPAKPWALPPATGPSLAEGEATNAPHYDPPTA